MLFVSREQFLALILSTYFVRPPYGEMPISVNKNGKRDRELVYRCHGELMRAARPLIE